MKILFINPPIQYAFLVPGPNRTWVHHELAPPLGIMALSAFIKSHGYNEIRLLNGQTAHGLSDQEILDELGRFQPDLVGITTPTYLLYNVIRIAGLIKQARPETKIVVGGPHLSHYPEETVAQPPVDFGVVGEGEYPLLELCRALEGGGDFGGIAGLAWKRGAETVLNPLREQLEPLDDLPLPDHSLFDLRQHRIPFDDISPTGVIISSRGCPFHCAFCSKLQQKYRMRTAASVVAEMEDYRDRGYRAITFYDDIFNLSKPRVLEICRLLKERRLDLAWSFRGRVNHFDEEMARAVAEAGCRRIYFGVESGTQSLLDSIDKGTTLDQIRQAFRLCHQNRLSTVAYFILGLPGETREQAKRTIAFAHELNPSYVIFQTLIPWPGAKIYNEAVASGGLTDYFRQFALRPVPDLQLQSWETGMKEEEIFKLILRGLLGFYFRPSYLFRSLAQVGNWENFRTKSAMALRLLYRMGLSLRE